MFPDLSTTTVIAFDTETTGVDRHEDYPVGYVLTWGFRPEESVYYPVRHTGGGNLEPGPVVEYFKKLLARTDLRVIMHNAAFDLWMAAKDGITINGPIEDTGLNDPLIEENQKKYSLAICCERAAQHCRDQREGIIDRVEVLDALLARGVNEAAPGGIPPQKERDILSDRLTKLVPVEAKKGEPMYRYLAERFGGKEESKQMANYHRLPGDDEMAVEYATGDGTSTLQLWSWQRVQIDIQNLSRVWKTECDLIPVLHRAESRGVPIDEEELGRVKTKVGKMRAAAMDEIGGINPRAPSEVGPYIESIATGGKSDTLPPVGPNMTKAERQQIVAEMWNEDKVPLPPRTPPSPRFPDGQPSYSTKYLESFPGGEKIVKVRKYAHLEDSFITPLIDTHLHNGKVFPRFHQLASDDYGTVTGRLSSSGPNMQQVTKRNKELGKIFRKVFVPPPGMTMWEMDYSQCEYRLFAHFANSTSLIKGYNEDGIDMHKMVAKLLGLSRDLAKNMNFGMLYGMGVKSLAGHLGVTMAEAKRLRNEYFAQIPEAKEFMEEASRRALMRGYIITLLGRRRRYVNPSKQSYQAINSICQGGNADIMKMKMVEVDDYLRTTGRGEFVLSVHDALLNYLDPAREHETANEIMGICENFTKEQHGFVLRTKMKMDAGHGANWAEASYGQEEMKIAA